LIKNKFTSSFHSLVRIICNTRLNLHLDEKSNKGTTGSYILLAGSSKFSSAQISFRKCKCIKSCRPAAGHSCLWLWLWLLEESLLNEVEWLQKKSKGSSESLRDDKNEGKKEMLTDLIKL
jgi:hypothetical protein